MIFVDTGSWYAIIDKDDQHHLAARQWLEQNQQILVTSNYVIVETLNLVKVRLGHQLACQLDQALWSESIAVLEWVSETDNRQTRHMFHKYADIGLSLQLKNSLPGIFGIIDNRSVIVIQNYTARYARISTGYLGQLVEWPEVITEGQTLEECRTLLKDALNEMILAYRQLGKELPIGDSLLESLPIEV